VAEECPRELFLGQKLRKREICIEATSDGRADDLKEVRIQGWLNSFLSNKIILKIS